MLPKFPNPLNSNNQTIFNSSNGGNQPDKKVIILGGGGLILILVVLGLLLFSGGGGNKNSKAWQDLVNNETQITVVANKYSQDLTDPNLQDATATTAITWQSNNKDTQKIYATNLGKGAKPPSQVIYKQLSTNLDAAKTAGNLDSVFASSLLKQLNLVETNIHTVSSGNLGSKTKSQLQSTSKLVSSTTKLLQPFVNSTGSSSNSDSN